jgi:uncharacterized protein
MRRVGIGWREEIAAGLVINLDQIEVIELVAERYFNASRSTIAALRFLARQRPVWIHGTSLGLASSQPAERARLERLARLIGAIEPAGWSEHLAFVRGGGREIGHLAAPPRNRATLEGLLRNLELARTATGSLPLLENVASLVDTPFSDWSEPEWLAIVAAETECDFLLDLHNFHTNSMNFSAPAERLLASLPPRRIRMIHLAGGKLIDGEGGPRVLDDHRSRVPDVVFELLDAVARRCTDFDVVIERDGEFPPVGELVDEMRRARAICSSVEVSSSPPEVFRPSKSVLVSELSSAMQARGEALLTSIFTSDSAMQSLASDPSAMLVRNALPPESAAGFDLPGLRMAAAGFARKRTRCRKPSLMRHVRHLYQRITIRRRVV